MARRWRWGGVALAVILAAALAGTAGATYPGKVGRLAFAMRGQDGKSDIYTALPDGSGLTRLTTAGAGERNLCAAYSPDGTSIAYCHAAADGSWEIWTMRSDGSHQRQVTHVGFAFFPDFSPDGQRLLFDGPDPDTGLSEIWVIDVNGEGLRQVTGKGKKGAADGNNFLAAWSPKGDRIVFISDRDGGQHVFVANAGGENARDLTIADQPNLVHDQLPDWSPDGQWIAFETQGQPDDNGDPPPNSGRIWKMRADGRDKQQLTNDPNADDFGAAWSPDGKQIAFVRNLADGSRPVVVMDADGGHPHAVIPGAFQFVPAWQPLDGNDDH